MLYDRRQLPELKFMKHVHDTETVNYDYESEILNKTLSPYLYENKTMAGFLDRLQPLMALFFDKMNIIKNWRNYMVDKYHYKGKG